MAKKPPVQQALERLLARVVDVQIGERTKRTVESSRNVSVLLTPSGTQEFVWVALTPAGQELHRGGRRAARERAWTSARAQSQRDGRGRYTCEDDRRSVGDVVGASCMQSPCVLY